MEKKFIHAFLEKNGSTVGRATIAYELSTLADGSQKVVGSAAFCRDGDSFTKLRGREISAGRLACRDRKGVSFFEHTINAADVCPYDAVLFVVKQEFDFPSTLVVPNWAKKSVLVVRAQSPSRVVLHGDVAKLASAVVEGESCCAFKPQQVRSV